jgi:hypothetical protein
MMVGNDVGQPNKSPPRGPGPPQEPGNTPEGEPGNAPEGEPGNAWATPEAERPPKGTEGTAPDPGEYAAEPLTLWVLRLLPVESDTGVSLAAERPAELADGTACDPGQHETEPPTPEEVSLMTPGAGTGSVPGF